MRALICLALFGAVANADWPEAKRRFEETYQREDATNRMRREAVLELSGHDSAAAADYLLKLWERLSKQTTKLRAELYRIRSDLRDLREKERNATKKAPSFGDRIAKLEAEDAPRNMRLAGIELDQSAILEGLRNLKSPEALAWLADEGLKRARSPALLHAVALQIATASATRVEALLAALERLRKPDQVVPILQALGKRGAPSVDPLIRHLVHPDWSVRVAAAYALARAAQPEGVGPVVEALQKEADRSRAQREMARALTILTGERIGPHPGLWIRWWNENGPRVRAGKIELGKGRPDAKATGKQGHYYGIPQNDDRIIYVLDVSGSMEVSMENPRWVDNSPVPAEDDEDSRFDAAVRELLRATKRLHRGSQYAVIVYSSHARKLHEKLVPATADEHAKLSNTMARMGPDGSTNIYEALDLALRMANVHSQFTRGASRADAIFLVSDGSPTDSKGESEDPERTLQAVREWNAGRRVAIHTIGIGRKHSSGFMQQLATENGGQYYAVLPKKGR
jgi:uncharacterized protein YegL